ncbi:MAG: HAMP domain-containing histidine kinase [Flavobacteriales bacterium]|nr:HAMP domain-containing histidine kinase [Flavobacteriales bacterium]
MPDRANSTDRSRWLLYLLTAAVLTFQGYWLWANYESRRQQLFERANLELEQELIAHLLKGLPQRNSNVRFSATAGLDLDSLVRSLNSSNVSHVVVNDLRTAAPSPAGRAQATSTPLQLMADSALFAGLRVRLAWLPSSGHLSIHRTTHGMTTAYPAHSEFDPASSTPAIASVLDPNTTYRLVIGSIRPLIMRDMSWPILASLLYLLLYTSTTVLLVRTAALNQQLLQSHARFTRNMTHELKIPISTLFVATESLEKQGHAPAHITAPMRKAVTQLSNIVDAVLDTARLQHRQVELARHMVPWRSLCDEVLAQIQPLIAEHGAAVRVEVQDESASMNVDPELFQRVLTNLIDNAMKYGGHPSQVRIAMSKAGGEDLILATDNGPGIAPEHVHAIFEPFFRAPAGEHYGAKGNGLGLSFVREVVALHGGTVRVEHTGPEGTTIAIRIPHP